MRDFCDGNAFKSNQLYSEEPNALQIQLYYDDIDVCNPIGSKSVIHKLGNSVYYKIMTIHDNYDSLLYWCVNRCILLPNFEY